MSGRAETVTKSLLCDDASGVTDINCTYVYEKEGGEQQIMALILIASMAVTTMALRFLPFFVFGENTPKYITYLGKVLPQATIEFQSN